MNLIQIKRQWGLHHVRIEMRNNLNLHKWRRWDNAVNNNNYLETKKKYKEIGKAISLAIYPKALFPDQFNDGYGLMNIIPRLTNGLRTYNGLGRIL